MTTTESSPEPATESTTARLAEFETVCRQLWPFVRYFAMAGACSDAITAVVNLAKLLGEPVDGSGYIPDVAKEVRDQTVEHVARWCEQSDVVRAKIGSRLAGEVATLIRDKVDKEQKP